MVPECSHILLIPLKFLGFLVWGVQFKINPMAIFLNSNLGVQNSKKEKYIGQVSNK